MKVLLISQIAVVDYKYTYSLANALKANGNEVELVIDDKKDNEYCKCMCHNKFLTSRKDINKFKKFTNYCSTYKYILKKAVNEKFDVVHVQWFQFSPIDYLYIKKMRKSGIKVIVTVHDILPFNEKKYDMHFHKKIYGLCNQIIVQAKTNIERFDELFPEDKNKVTYIPHGHFLDFADVHDKEESRKKLGIPDDKKVYLFFGQIKKVKGVGVLLKSFGEAAKKRDDIFLIVAGNVWKDEWNQYKDIISEESLDEAKLKLDIRFVPDELVGYYYSACDIAVLPYLDVYQSGVIQLTYAYSKPAIASAISPFMEIVQDGKNGFVFQTGNVEELENTILKSANISNEKLYDMGTAGKQLIAEKYSWTDIAAKITNLYKLD
jgi:Glycosyltransferase